MKLKNIIAPIALSASLLTPIYGNSQETVPNKSPSENSLEKRIDSSEKSSKKYSSLIKEIEETRDSLKKEYRSASDSEKQEILDYSKEYVLEKISEEIIPAWKGTRYNFHGSSKMPQGEDGIACGHYITAVLDHAGFNIDRYSLGMQRSGNIIKSLTSNIKNRNNQSSEEMFERIKNEKDGIYILGLSNHTGFIINQNKNIEFCHSLYYPPNEVSCENAKESSAISSSIYKVTGKLLGDSMIKDWIKNNHIETIHSD